MVDDPMMPRVLPIRQVREETRDTVTLELSPPDGRGFAFSPGQFNMLYLYGMGEVPISISGDPVNPELLVHTIRSVGTVTKAMRRMKRGDSLGVRGPFGNRWPMTDAEGKDVLVVAGGLGLAPLRPVIYQLIAQRSRYGKVALLYGTRTPEDILFRRELEQWRSRFDMEVEIIVDRATSPWHGNVGVVTTLIPRVHLDPDHAVAMVCGPEIMMRFTLGELEKRGMGADQLYVSMERNMKCGIGSCGHCQYQSVFVCKDGPVFRYDRIRHLFSKREI